MVNNYKHRIQFLIRFAIRFWIFNKVGNLFINKGLFLKTQVKINSVNSWLGTICKKLGSMGKLYLNRNITEPKFIYP